MRRMGIVMWGLVLAGFLAAGESMRGQTIDVLHNFTGGTGDASRPLAGLAGPDQAGNLYGTTVDGGVYGVGTVFKLDPAGNETVLHSFNGLNGDGANPQAGVVLDDAGNLYGTTAYGGASGFYGTVFKLDPAGNETVLHSFTGLNGDGSNPQAGLVRDDAGNLYGTTYSGGTSYHGTVFKLDPAGNFTVLHQFTGIDGTGPQAGLIRDNAGNLYGTTYYGGTSDRGTAFMLDPAGHETVLHSFTGFNGDGSPQAGLVRDDAGNLYGTTAQGGTNHDGTVFMLDPAGHHSVLHNFACLNGDGCYPHAGLIRDDAGNLYGTTYYGDTGSDGIVFRLDPAGNETVLHSFILGSGDGANPEAGLVRDDAGNLYGTTEHGGENDQGAIFKVDALFHETVLFSFLPLSTDGANPWAGLVLDDAGNLYGTTYYGGTNGQGTLFKVDPAGNETVLHRFTGLYGDGDGANPYAGLVFDDAGNLYGTTALGGTNWLGTIFKLDPAGNETVLYRFGGFNGDGIRPRASLIRDDAGNLYGTTAYGGGIRNVGTVFKLDSDGNETVLHHFTGTDSDGAYPLAGLVRDDAGNLYGTTYVPGTVFKLDPAGNETVLHSFGGPDDGDGCCPEAGLVLDDAGNLYGTTGSGGINRQGTVFKIDPAGNKTVLYRFTGTNGDGAAPYAGLIRDAAGNLYGTTFGGGIHTAGSPYGLGTVFMLDPAGNETVLYSFTGADNDGANPRAGLIFDDAGNLYGTTLHGGTNGQGIVFRLPRQ